MCRAFTLSAKNSDSRIVRIREHKRKGKEKEKPNWAKELKYILKGGGKLIPTSVVCDVFIDSKKTKQKYAFEIKAPLPNSDQSKVSKEKMFKLLAMNHAKVNNAYYALAYNPYGKKKDYNWSFPMRWFDMHNDESVLIGDEFWEFIGGKGTYNHFVSEINSLGKEYRGRIYSEFLGIKPPDGFEESILR